MIYVSEDQCSRNDSSCCTDTAEARRRTRVMQLTDESDEEDGEIGLSEEEEGVTVSR